MTTMQAVMNIFFAGMRFASSATTRPYAIAPRNPPYAMMNWSTWGWVVKVEKSDNLAFARQSFKTKDFWGFSGRY